MFPEALATVHCRFEQIHPFLDGNGRTGRLILNLVLVRLGYPPAIVYKRDRARYPACVATRRRRRAKSTGRDARTGDPQQPAPLRHPGGGRAGPARSAGRTGNARHQGAGTAGGGGTGGGSAPPADPTVNGAPPAGGSTSTWQAATDAAIRPCASAQVGVVRPRPAPRGRTSAGSTGSRRRWPECR